MMRQQRLRLVMTALAIVGCALIATSATVAAGNGHHYEVTVTNLTRGQVLSPPIVIVHDASFHLFTPGAPAIPELAQVAEDAVAGPLMALLGTMPSVGQTQIGMGPLPPGHSASFDIDTAQPYDSFTVVGMLVTTNDGFYSARGMLGAPAPMSAPAWDAGSEGNTEDCAHIPGPPCGHPGVHVTDSAEGFVHIHAGIHGIGDLPAEQFDWRNPAALVTTRLVLDGDDEGGDDEGDEPHAGQRVGGRSSSAGTDAIRDLQ